MGKRLLSLRWRTLSRKGFIIESGRVSADERAYWFAAFLKHPVTLLIVGFILTGVLGSYLTQIQEERLREREATGKSMDELRTSFDDLSQGFLEVNERAVRVMDLREARSSPKSIDDARTPYSDAYVRLQEKIVVDGQNIAQRYPFPNSKDEIKALMDNMTRGVALTNACINFGDLKFITDGASKSWKIVCPGYKRRTTAFDTIALDALCSEEFTDLLRPDPKYDFVRDKAVVSRIHNSLESVKNNCNRSDD